MTWSCKCSYTDFQDFQFLFYFVFSFGLLFQIADTALFVLSLTHSTFVSSQLPSQQCGSSHCFVLSYSWGASESRSP